MPLLAHAVAGDGRMTVAAAGRRDALVTGLLDGLAELSAYGATAARIQHVADADITVRQANTPAVRVAAAGTAGTAGIVSGLTIAAMFAAGARAVAAGGTSPILLGVMVAAGLVAFDTLSTLPSAFAALGRCLSGLRRATRCSSAQRPCPTRRVRRAPRPG